MAPPFPSSRQQRTDSDKSQSAGKHRVNIYLQHTTHTTWTAKIYLNRVYDNPYFGVSKVVRISKSSILRKWFHLKSHGHTRFNISCWNSNICPWSLEVKTPPLSNLVQVPFMSLYNNI